MLNLLKYPCLRILIFIVIFSGCKTHIVAPNYFISANIKNKPFQVISATNTSYVESQKPVSKKDILDINDQLNMTDGHLLMVHSSGKFIEISDDTLLNVSAANTRINSEYKIKPTDIRPDLSILFSTKYKPHMVHDGVYMYPGYIMNFDDIQTISSDSICLKWKSFREPSPSNYKVIITNMFDEPIFETSTSDTQYLFDFNDAHFGIEPMILVKVSSDDMDFMTQAIPIRISDSKEYYVPYFCEPSNAPEALELAFSMEHYYYMVDDAKKYYQLATELSDNSIYDQLFSNYLMRRDPTNK